MNSDGPRYRFGPFVLIPSEHVLLRDDTPVRLPRRDFELLVILVERAGHLLRKEELQQRLWPDTTVEEGNLTKHVSTLRKALGDGDGGSPYIATVPRVGFRFSAPVARVDEAVPVARPPAAGRRPLAAVLLGLLLVTGILAVVMSRRVDWGLTAAREWRAVAVLPFTALGSDGPDQLGLALADGIITRLGGQALLPVRPTSAVRRLPGGSRAAPADVGRILNVDVFLEGHIQRDRDTVRVTVQLTDVESGSPVWAQTFDEPTAGLFRLEDAIADRVARALRLQLAAAEQQRLRRRYTEHADAYAAYVDGRAQLLNYTPAGAQSAVAAFERALTFDPGYTLARAGLAMASADMYLRYAPERELQTWGDRARREALAAIALDPDLAEAHVAQAAVSRKREFDWDETVAASRRSLVLNPNLDQPRYFVAAALYHSGLMEEAVAEMERGRQVGGADRVEPLRIEGLVALFSGQFTRARERLEEVSRQSTAPSATPIWRSRITTPVTRRAGARCSKIWLASPPHQRRRGPAPPWPACSPGPVTSRLRAEPSTRYSRASTAITTSSTRSAPPSHSLGTRQGPSSGCDRPPTAAFRVWSGTSRIPGLTHCGRTRHSSPCLPISRRGAALRGNGSSRRDLARRFSCRPGIVAPTST